MIARLKNHSRDPSPSNSARESPVVNESKVQPSGIAAYDSPVRDNTTVSDLADESVVDDLLFGGADESNESAQSRQSPKAQSSNSPLFRNFERPSLQMMVQQEQQQETEQADDTLDLETSMDSAGLYDISGTVDSSFRLGGGHEEDEDEALISDVEVDEGHEEGAESDRSLDSAVEVVSNASALQLQQPPQKVVELVVEEEVPLTPIQIIMQQQQRLMQQQQQRQQSPLKEAVPVSRKAATSPSPVARQMPQQQGAPPLSGAARSKSPVNPARLSVEASKSAPATSAPSPVVKTVPRRDPPVAVNAPRIAPAVEVRSVVRNVTPSSLDADTVPPTSSGKLVINSPANPVERRASVPAESPSQAKPVSPLVRMEQVYQYAENDEEEEEEEEKVVSPERKRESVSSAPQEGVAKSAPPSSAKKSAAAPSPVTKSSTMAAPVRRTPVEPVVSTPKQSRQEVSPERFTANPLKAPPSANKEAATIRVALARAATETIEPAKKSAPAARPVSAARARPSAESQQSPLKLAPVSKEAPDSSLAANQSHSPSRGPLIERPVKVAVRVRPFTTTELAEGARRTISRNGEKLIIVNPKAFDAEPDTIAAAAVAMDNKQWAQIFQYNHFLWARDRSDPSPPTEQRQYVNQEDVHDSIGREIVESVLHGVSASCFAYGHTSTGKTHSLFGNIVGNHSHKASSNSRSTTPLKGQGSSQAALALAATSATSITSESGLIPRVMFDIISAVNSRDMFGSDTRMFFSFVEIYNEKIIDLLVSDAAMLETTRLGSSDTGASVAASALKAREHPVLGTYVENLNKVEVSSPEEVLRLIARGQSNRATTCTAWNTTSSRSHAIVTLELSPANYSQNVKFISPSSKNNDKFNPHSASSVMGGSDPHQHLFTRVQMVDLAGSEKDSNWGSGSNSTGHDEHGIWKGSRYNDTTPNKLAEATADKEKNELKLIRRSLSTLGYIIKALAKGAAFKSLPYRDSVLTFLLRDALNGHNHTTMLATISPADNCYEETLSTLRYAEKLCSLRGVHHGHAHHGLPGGNHHMNVSYGSPVTSLVASDKDMIQSRKALLEEFGRIHDGLGHNRPGSNASRQLHKQTISDPQQRIAKMTKLVYSTEVTHGEMHGARDDIVQDVGISASSSGMSTPNGKNRRLHQQVSFTSPVDGSTKDVYSLTTSDLDALKSSYRALQGQLIETQIDVESVKADRDTLTVDLKIAREQLLAVEQTKSDSRSTIASLTRSFKAAEKEINEYRALLRKKEESLERVVGEISSEKQGRLDAEHAYHARTKEFLSRFESMKKENKNLSSSLEVMSNKYRGFGDEKKDLLAQIDKLRVVVKTLTTDRDALVSKNQSLSSECELLKAQLHSSTTGSATELSDYERANAELMLLIGRLQTGLGAVTSERDDLLRMVAQKDELLGAQSQQAESTIRILQQRQAVQDKSEQTASEAAAAVHNEDFGRLHESLRELFTSEGQVLHSELLDTKKLTAMIRNLREKMLLHQSLENLLQREKVTSQKLRTMYQEFRSTSEKVSEDVRIEASAQHDYLRSQLEEARAKIAALTLERQQQQQSALLTPLPLHPQYANSMPFGAYPQVSPQTFLPTQGLPHQFASTFHENNINSTSINSHLHSSTVSMSTNALEVQLRTECNLLREQLVQSQTECNRAKEEARAALDSQHKEQASLWASMQEANRDMAAKDLALHDLAAERDRALHERDALAERLRMVSTECAELQQDLRELDADLVAAVEMTTGAGRMGGGLALHKVPDRMMHGIMRRRQKLQQAGGEHFDQQQQQQQQQHRQTQQSTSYPPAAPLFQQQSGSLFDPHSRNVESHFNGQQRSAFPSQSQPQQAQQFHDSHFGFDTSVPSDTWDEQQQQQFNSHHQSQRHTTSSSSNHQLSQHQQLHSHHQQQQQSTNFGPSYAQQYRGDSVAPSPHTVQQQQRGGQSFNHPSSNLSNARTGNSNTTQQRVSPSTTLRSSAASVNSSGSGGHGLHRQQQPEDEQQYDLSEKILQRQIEELSDFLDDEAKLKRSRLQRGSNGSLSSLAQSNASKRTKLYTPTTKLNFDF
eukprot:gene21826-27896_t